APGDRIKITGVLRLREPKARGTIYLRYLDAIHIEELQKDYEELEIDEEEERAIRELAADPDIFEKLRQSVAPSIYGYEIVKRAIAMQMFGGVKKLLPDQTRKRGDVHILLIGDPGTGKSQLLQYTQKIAPKSIYLVGKMASGAGLTVTAEKDDFAGGSWALKAGALVLASGGMAAIDELDKMGEDDRSALHESMEQQTVSVAKAGLVGTFKTETSILAAANPKFGRFDPTEIPTAQFDLPPTLMSRFDLFYVIKDVMDRTKDLETAKHILTTQRVGSIMAQQERGIDSNDHIDLKEAKKKITPSIEPDLMRKYISYAKKNFFPTLTQGAEEVIEKFYMDLRDMGRKEKTVPTTARQLDALVRLTEASARVRLSNEATKEDAERAVQLVRTSMQEVGVDPETGKIDMDIIATGKSHSQVERMKGLIKIVRELQAEFDLVPVKKVLEEAEKQSMDRDKASETLEKLKRSGELYSPRHGFIKTTGD
ncbi:MAG: minichromosome maintenance protein MCM, partial [Candidatus Diapherotrites archaeon]|nr:minichromosome maintenance protein MCM [Candidatus Diapherotrites archaeon]